MAKVRKGFMLTMNHEQVYSIHAIEGDPFRDFGIILNEKELNRIGYHLYGRYKFVVLDINTGLPLIFLQTKKNAEKEYQKNLYLIENDRKSDRYRMKCRRLELMKENMNK